MNLRAWLAGSVEIWGVKITAARALVAMVIFASLALISSSFWLFPAGTTPSPSRDFSANLLPYVMAKAQLLAGHNPFASQWYSGESNLLNPIWGFLYPPAMLLTLALPIITMARALVLLHVLLGWFSMWLLARDFCEHPIPPIFAGLLYVFSGAWAARLLSYHFNLLIGLALMPLAWWGFRRLMDRLQAKDGFLIGVVLAAMLYAGAMYLTPFTLVAFTLVALVLLIFRPEQRRRRVGLFSLALLVFTLVSAPKLIPNLMQGLSAARPAPFIAAWYDEFAALIMPGDIWPFYLPHSFVWRWNEANNYLSVAGVLLAILGWWMLLKSQRRHWAWAFLAVIVAMVYWSLGFPPLGLISVLTRLRVVSRALMVVSMLACLFAGIGFDALLAKRVRVPAWMWALLIVGLALEMGVMLVRAFPDAAIVQYLPLFGGVDTEQQAITFELLLALGRWHIVRGVMLAGLVLALLSLGLVVSRVRISFQALVLPALALLLTATVMAATPVELAADPLQNPSLQALRSEVKGGVIALAANIDEKDKRGLIELALAGEAHLLNPIYGSFGQDVSAEWLQRMDYVLSAQPLIYDVQLWRYWSPFGVFATVPVCKLALVGEFTAEDPVTRDDLPEFRSKQALIEAKAEPFTLYLYAVDPDACPDPIRLQ